MPSKTCSDIRSIIFVTLELERKEDVWVCPEYVRLWVRACPWLIRSMTIPYSTDLILPPVVSVSVSDSVFISTSYRTLGSTHVQSYHTPTFFSRFRESEAFVWSTRSVTRRTPSVCCAFIKSYSYSTILSSAQWRARRSKPENYIRSNG